MNQKELKITIITAIAILLVGVGGVFAYLHSAKIQTPPSNSENIIQESLFTGSHTSDQSAEIQGWKTYRNEQYGYAFKYPEAAMLRFAQEDEDILSDTIIEFENYGSLYDPAVISFSVYKKDSYQHYRGSDQCEIYRRYMQIYTGREADIVEQADCPGSEGSAIGGSGHTFTAIFSLSATEELVVMANLRNAFIKETGLVNKILSTLTFIN
jgi:hypothetical protein